MQYHHAFSRGEEVSDSLSEEVCAIQPYIIFSNNRFMSLKYSHTLVVITVDFVCDWRFPAGKQLRPIHSHCIRNKIPGRSTIYKKCNLQCLPSALSAFQKNVKPIHSHHMHSRKRLVSAVISTHAWGLNLGCLVHCLIKWHSQEKKRVKAILTANNGTYHWICYGVEYSTQLIRFIPRLG